MKSKTELKVIGAGFGRTGTTSLKKALEILGVGPCFHLNEIINGPDEQVKVCITLIWKTNKILRTLISIRWYQDRNSITHIQKLSQT